MANDTQSNETPTIPSLIQQGIKNYMKDVHTGLPGNIISFDPVTQLAEVQILISRKFINDQVEPLPKLINVPVHFFRAGGFLVTTPIKQGDECLVLFLERSIDRWLKSGGVQEPQDQRMHSLTDAVCFVGLTSQPNVISEYDNENFQLRNELKDQTITLKLDKDIEVKTGDVEITLHNSTNTIDMIAPTAVNIDTPIATFTGDVQVDGSVNIDTDLDVAGSSSLSSTVTSNGTDISNSHKHDDSGTYNISGTPVVGNSGTPE